MNRRIALLVSFIGLNLMACCCGGVGNTPAVNAPAAKSPGGNQGKENQAEKGGASKEKLDPNWDAAFNEIENAKNKEIGDLKRKVVELDQQYKEPVYKLPNLPNTPAEFITRFGKPIEDRGSKGEMRTKSTYMRWLIYQEDGLRAVYLVPDGETPPKTWKIQKYLHHKTGEVYDADAVAKILSARDIEQHAIDAKKKAARRAHDETTKPFRDSIALATKERDKAIASRNKIIADKEKAARDAEAARLAAIEAAKPKVTRANYGKVVQGMSLAEAQDILGPGKEAAQSGGIQVVTWQSTPGLLEQVTIISATFQNNRLVSKSIIGP